MSLAAPFAPENLTVTPVSTTSMNVSWDPPSVGTAYQYRVSWTASTDHSKDNSSVMLNTEAKPTSPRFTYVASNLVQGELYTVTVVSQTESGNQSLGNPSKHLQLSQYILFTDPNGSK